MMERTRLHLIRHGEVERSHCYNGQYDVRLTARGEEQYQLLKPRLDPDRISALYTSDLVRTVRGGEILGPYLGVEPVKVPQFRELNCGEWQGLSVTDIQRDRPDEWAARLADLEHFRAPGGESLGDLAGRVLPALKEIVARHRGEEVLVVAHGGVNRVILMDAIGAPLSSFFSIDQHYCCVNLIDYYADGNTVVQLVNG
ncbi:adenosylcobalamin-5'-phosphate phosphatase, putative [Citrifermentans bemidjiense Bem]|uniref:Adenosylcobalamin-5'-phosphate phosphatase, putative n=1 Tax=Citrifermentans bemidjiense (strain ATCC BAA-1014 / DSM 16622 / JCM 12645 / Bem) TaxID=404380 RepID=B5EEL7_CITBB|nr:histidine phosphatase family protein [Citrifermentans bemidjiense]ACH40803.1 adenosylcobalamin-5'-phosphate phosphatase, putative [Citrifermentans bemidjiense Bem]